MLIDTSARLFQAPSHLESASWSAQAKFSGYTLTLSCTIANQKGLLCVSGTDGDAFRIFQATDWGVAEHKMKREAD